MGGKIHFAYIQEEPSRPEPHYTIHVTTPTLITYSSPHVRQGQTTLPPLIESLSIVSPSQTSKEPTSNTLSISPQIPHLLSLPPHIQPILQQYLFFPNALIT